jgi:hypothetical protein
MHKETKIFSEEEILKLLDKISEIQKLEAKKFLEKFKKAYERTKKISTQFDEK